MLPESGGREPVWSHLDSSEGDGLGVAGGTYVVGSDCPIFVQGRTTSSFYEQPSTQRRKRERERDPGPPSFLPNSSPLYFPLSLFFLSSTSVTHFFLVLWQLPFCHVGGVTCFSTRSRFILLLPPFLFQFPLLPLRVTRKTRSCARSFSSLCSFEF